MADIILAQGDSLPGTMQARYRDMADGTHALVIWAGDSIATVAKIDALPRWEYLGGETLNPNGASVNANLPNNTTIIEIRPEDQECFFLINGAPATANSPGYITMGGGEILGPLSNLNSLAVFQVAAGLTHIMYFREVA